MESAGKHSGREEEEGKGEGSKVDEWLEADYFGNGSMTVNLVASWDILLGGDVVAIAELLRAQLLLVCVCVCVRVYSVSVALCCTCA